MDKNTYTRPTRPLRGKMRTKQKRNDPHVPYVYVEQTNRGEQNRISKIASLFLCRVRFFPSHLVNAQTLVYMEVREERIDGKQTGNVMYKRRGKETVLKRLWVRVRLDRDIKNQS